MGVAAGINGPQFIAAQLEAATGRDRNGIAVDPLAVDVILDRRIIHRSTVGNHGRGQRQRVAKSGGVDARERGGSFRFVGIFLGNDQRKALLDLAAVGIRCEDGDLVDASGDGAINHNPIGFDGTRIRILIRSGKANPIIAAKVDYRFEPVVCYSRCLLVDLTIRSYLIVEGYLR